MFHTCTNLFPSRPAALILAHGNVEVERRFSDRGKTVTVWNSSSKASTSNLLIATDELKVFGTLSHHVPIFLSFIKLGQSVYKNYHFQVKKERKKEVEKRRLEQQVQDSNSGKRKRKRN